MPRVVHFEIHAADLERAKKFYETVFDLEIKKWNGPIDYMMVMTGRQNSQLQGKEGQGIDGGMLLRHGPTPVDGAPVNAYICTM